MISALARICTVNPGINTKTSGSSTGAPHSGSNPCNWYQFVIFPGIPRLSRGFSLGIHGEDEFFINLRNAEDWRPRAPTRLAAVAAWWFRAIRYTLVLYYPDARQDSPSGPRFRKDFCWIYALLLEDVRTGFDLMVRRFGSVDFAGDVGLFKEV